MFGIPLSAVIWAVFIKPVGFLQTTLHWQIDPALPINQTHLVQKIQPLISNQYWPDLYQIKQHLEAEPWIESVQIRRLLWNAIQIHINAQTIGMRWHNIDCKVPTMPGCYGYISTKGTLFTPKKTVPSNAALAITKPDQNVLTQLYKDYQHYQAMAQPLSIQSISKRHVETLSFQSGVSVILGEKQQKQRLTRFIKAYHQLKKQEVKIQQATFDMRYTKGFALSHRQ